MEQLSFEELRELVTTSFPDGPRSTDFTDSEAYEAAWRAWQSDTMDDAFRRLDYVAKWMDSAAAGTWSPGSLVEVAMLRGAVLRERMVGPEGRVFSDTEVQAVQGRLQALNPLVEVDREDDGERLFIGFADSAHVFLQPGVYRARGCDDDRDYRLVVGTAGWQMEGEVSAAFPVPEAAVESSQVRLSGPGLARALAERRAELIPPAPEMQERLDGWRGLEGVDGLNPV